MFLMSNEVRRELVTANHIPSEEEVSNALWSRFSEEANGNVISARST